MIAGPAGMIYIGCEPPYGQLGGSMIVWDPSLNAVAANYHNLITNQSVVSLTYETTSGLIFGGSGNYGGGGTNPTQPQAVIFAFDPVKKVVLYQLTPLTGAVVYQSIASANGKVFAATGSQVYVIDPTKKAVTNTLMVPGIQIQTSLGLYKGKLYGLTSTSVYMIDPVALTVTVLGSPTVPIQRGFAVTDSGVYFGSGSHLWRWKF